MPDRTGGARPRGVGERWPLSPPDSGAAAAAAIGDKLAGAVRTTVTDAYADAMLWARDQVRAVAILAALVGAVVGAVVAAGAVVVTLVVAR